MDEDKESSAEDSLFAAFEEQFSETPLCRCTYKCLGLGEGKWFLRFSCPGCARWRVPTESRNIVPLLCCDDCADWVLHTARSNCSLCGWEGHSHGRVAVVAYLDPEGTMVVGEDIAQVVAIMDSTPEYVIGDEDHGAFDARQEETPEDDY